MATLKKFEEAISVYNKAYDLTPEPKNNFEATTWVITAIGDSCFLGTYYTSGQEAFSYALTCPNGLGNPFIHMRLGQCEFELGNIQRAIEEQLRAYMDAGIEIFQAEPPKYFSFLKENVKPPVATSGEAKKPLREVYRMCYIQSAGELNVN